jgi:hypothetical protein
MIAAGTNQAEFVEGAKKFASSLSSLIEAASQAGLGMYTDQLKDAAQVRSSSVCYLSSLFHSISFSQLFVSICNIIYLLRFFCRPS